MYQRCACVKLFFCIGSGKDTTTCNNRYLSTCFLMNIFTISVLLAFTGKPLTPPAPMVCSLWLVVCSCSLLIVVFDATRPSNFISSANSITSSICSVVRSGAIFKNIGLGFKSLAFRFYRFVNILCKASFSCNSLKPGVLGLLTFTTK